jgi:hypothetical protein
MNRDELCDKLIDLKIKKVIFVFFLFYTSNLMSQSFIDYFRQACELDYFMSNNRQFDNAYWAKILKSHRILYNLVPKKNHLYNIRKDTYIVSIAALGDTVSAQEFIDRFKNIIPIDKLKCDINTVLNCSSGHNLEMCYYFITQIDLALKDTLQVNKEIENIYADSFVNKLIEDDQKNRTKRKKVENYINYDSINFIKLKSYFSVYGYPILSHDSIRDKLATILCHIDDENKFEEIKETLVRAMYMGLLHPSDYAFAYDRSRVNSDKKPIYYWFIPGTYLEMNYKPSLEELPIVNSSRFEIGLPLYPRYLDSHRY